MWVKVYEYVVVQCSYVLVTKLFGNVFYLVFLDCSRVDCNLLTCHISQRGFTFLLKFGNTLVVCVFIYFLLVFYFTLHAQ